MDLASDDDVRKTLENRGGRGRGFALGALGLALLVGLVWWAYPRGARDTGGFETKDVERGQLALTVTAVGKLEPLDEVSVSSELSGIVRQVYVEANDTVHAGQVLAELDTQVLTAQARQSHAQVDAGDASVRQALANVNAAKVERDRAKDLIAKNAISQAAYDQARTSHEVAVASLALAEAQLRQARASDDAAHTNLEKARIVSPIDGVVLERNVEPGQAVVSALQAATLFRVARDLSKMKVEVEVDEADVGRIEPGQSADFTVAAFTDRVFDAHVEKVDLAPVAATDVVTYAAHLTLENPDLVLRPGMTATASIATESFDEVLLVPNSALRFEPPKSELAPPEPREGRRVARVWIVGDDGEPRAVEVLPLATDGRHTVIEEGPLTEGDVVITGVVEKTRR
ncbi:MAG: efflux RND transporter periplasmic adaptor subunit [Alphaproteobacteria bacterium]|nr:efflux RND transporter periplasmic adaptor subunit [Alphaproteobacteria bacterium]